MVRPIAVGIVGTIVVATSCIMRSGSVEGVAPPARADTMTTHVRSPMKAFLVDASTIVYGAGANVPSDSILGAGVHYSLGMRDTLRLHAVAMDSVVGIEAFEGGVDVVG